MRTFPLVVALLFLGGSGTLAFDCAGVKLPSSLVICSDPELMRLADERQEAFSEAMTRLNDQQQKANPPVAQPAPLASPASMPSTASTESALDAPAIPDRPTARTELRRALDASGACEGLMNHLPWTTEGNLDVLKYYGCMNKIVSDAAQSMTYSEAFETGMYFEITVRSSIEISVIEQYPSGRTSETDKTLQHFGKIYLDKTIELGQKQHLTLDEICEGVGYKDCQKSVLPGFVKLGWASR